jgi:hypothetical protein
MNPCYSDFGFDMLFAEAGQSYGCSEGRPQEQISWLKSRGLLEDGICALDVGCYDGRFLARMPESVRKIGVDIDEQAIRNGKEQFGKKIEFIWGRLENFCSSAPVDTITMFHVLEHLRNPVAVLRNLRSLAHASSRLVIEVPIIEKGLTNDINGFFSVQHMTHFSSRSLENCLTQSGWHIVERYELPNYNGYRVLAKPYDGGFTIEENIQDINHSYRYLSHWYDSLQKINTRLQELPDETHFVIWGGGLHTEFLYHLTSLFKKKSINSFSIVDSDPMKQGKSWRGIKIYPPSEISGMDWLGTYLLISSYGSQEIIAKAALGLNAPNEKIIKLYDDIHVY